MTQSIAIIIPSLNSPIIDRVLDAIEQQEMSDEIAEILVVGKDDQNLIPANSRITFLDTGSSVPPGKARNIGIKATDANLLIFLDSDCLVQTGWLREHIKAHADGHVIVGGSILPEGDNYWHLSYNLAMFHEILAANPPSSKLLLPTINLSVERHVIEQIGTMNEQLRRAEDMDWTLRMSQAGFKINFCPTAVVKHDHNRKTFNAVWSDCVWTGYFSRQVRLHYQSLFRVPFWLKYRLLIRLLSPFIAFITTMHIIGKRATVFYGKWNVLPAIFLTKLAWAWGAGLIIETESTANDLMRVG